MTEYTAKDDPYSKYNFEVEIDGETVAGFAEVSGLTMELDTVQYREGGVNDHVHQLPGQFVHANLVLQRGLTKDTSFWHWIQEVMSGEVTRKNLVIKIKDSFKGDSTWGWEFKNAYPTKWRGPDLASHQRGMAIESIELAYERFTRMSGMPE
ncbi:phage tail protein [Halostella pelagica]|uniref:phage tail protein n=1 Tax=Halostella pelagica TaxID=2583824 RepID=UPI0010817993|nr:phage tail protein [Halostella pelagica]